MDDSGHQAARVIGARHVHSHGEWTTFKFGHSFRNPKYWFDLALKSAPENRCIGCRDSRVASLLILGEEPLASFRGLIGWQVPPALLAGCGELLSLAIPRQIMPEPRWLNFLLASLVCLSSCTQSGGPPKKVCFPVKGELLVKGQPASGAVVVLRPATDSNPESWSNGFPRGHVAADGKFEVGTYGDKDGAPAGDYVVLVSWEMPNPQNEEAPATDRLGGRYSDPSSSKLAAKVEAHPTELPPIRLP